MVVTINGGVRYPIGVAQYTGVTHPNFRGASTVNSNSVFEKTPLTDTVEISSKEEKKKGLSTGAKWGIGLVSTALAIYGSVVAHRAITRPTLEKTAKSFSEIFGRNISKEEAKTLLSEYKELFKIKDADEFYEKAFNQVKKDYGLEKANIKLRKLYKDDPLLDKYTLGQWREFYGTVFIKMPISQEAERTLLKTEKLDVISTMIHELKHAKQSELVSRLPDDVLIDDYSRRWRKRYAELVGPKAKTPEEFKKERKLLLKDAFTKEMKTKLKGKECKDGLQKVFELLNLEKLKPETPEYEQAMKYLKENVNCSEGIIRSEKDYAKYRAQLTEQEAFRNQNMFEELKYRITSIWR
jgi:hypothetical protein